MSDHGPKPRGQLNRHGRPVEFFFDEGCDCEECCNERAQAQAFQDFSIARLGRHLSKAIREGNEKKADYLFDGAEKALRVWPFLPVRVQ